MARGAEKSREQNPAIWQSVEENMNKKLNEQKKMHKLMKCSENRKKKEAEETSWVWVSEKREEKKEEKKKENEARRRLRIGKEQSKETGKV